MKKGATQENVDYIKFVNKDLKAAIKPSQKTVAKNAELLASELKQMQLNLLHQIKPDDLNRDYEKNFPGKEQLPITQMGKLYDKLVDMVGSDLLLCDNKAEMIKVYEFYAAVADQCMEKGDYQSARAINDGLTQMSIERLGFNFSDNVSKQSKESLARVSELFDPKKAASMANYNNKLKSHSNNDTVVVPSIAYFLTQKSFISGNEDLTGAAVDKTEHAVVTQMKEFISHATAGEIAANLNDKLNHPSLRADSDYRSSRKATPDVDSIDGRSKAIKRTQDDVPFKAKLDKGSSVMQRLAVAAITPTNVAVQMQSKAILEVPEELHNNLKQAKIELSKLKEAPLNEADVERYMQARTHLENARKILVEFVGEQSVKPEIKELLASSISTLKAFDNRMQKYTTEPDFVNNAINEFKAAVTAYSKGIAIAQKKFPTNDQTVLDEISTLRNNFKSIKDRLGKAEGQFGGETKAAAIEQLKAIREADDHFEQHVTGAVNNGIKTGNTETIKAALSTLNEMANGIESKVSVKTDYPAIPMLLERIEQAKAAAAAAVAAPVVLAPNNNNAPPKDKEEKSGPAPVIDVRNNNNIPLQPTTSNDMEAVPLTSSPPASPRGNSASNPPITEKAGKILGIDTNALGGAASIANSSPRTPKGSPRSEPASPTSPRSALGNILSNIKAALSPRASRQDPPSRRVSLSEEELPTAFPPQIDLPSNVEVKGEKVKEVKQAERPNDGMQNLRTQGKDQDKAITELKAIGETRKAQIEASHKEQNALVIRALEGGLAPNPRPKISPSDSHINFKMGKQEKSQVIAALKDLGIKVVNLKGGISIPRESISKNPDFESKLIQALKPAAASISAKAEQKAIAELKAATANPLDLLSSRLMEAKEQLKAPSKTTVDQDVGGSSRVRQDNPLLMQSNKGIQASTTKPSQSSTTDSSLESSVKQVRADWIERVKKDTKLPVTGEPIEKPKMKFK